MKKILILSMSCNNAYFKSLLAAVKDTWVKPVLQNKYENVDWFAYTACDARHPIPEIDYDDHIIYVDSPDDVEHTYEKTKKAYELLKQTGYTCDFVVRTNCTVYVNIKNLIKKINTLDDNIILGEVYGYYHTIDGKRIFKWNIIRGMFACYPEKLFGISLSLPLNYLNDNHEPDDVLMSGVLHNSGEKYYTICPNDREEVPRYKFCSIKEHNNGVICPDIRDNHDLWLDDPKEINNNVVIQFRTIYGEFEKRVEQGHEHEHLYELYFAEIQ